MGVDADQDHGVGADAGAPDAAVAPEEQQVDPLLGAPGVLLRDVRDLRSGDRVLVGRDRVDQVTGHHRVAGPGRQRAGDGNREDHREQGAEQVLPARRPRGPGAVVGREDQGHPQDDRRDAADRDPTERLGLERDLQQLGAVGAEDVESGAREQDRGDHDHADGPQHRVTEPGLLDLAADSGARRSRARRTHAADCRSIRTVPMASAEEVDWTSSSAGTTLRQHLVRLLAGRARARPARGVVRRRRPHATGPRR